MNKEGPGTTANKLRELLTRSPVSHWQSERLHGAAYLFLKEHGGDFLRVVEAVAELNERGGGGVWDSYCPMCGGEVDGHRSDCAWVLARKLTGAP